MLMVDLRGEWDDRYDAGQARPVSAMDVGEVTDNRRRRRHA
jgi:hypothetical protein